MSAVVVMTVAAVVGMVVVVAVPAEVPAAVSRVCVCARAHACHTTAK